MNAHDEEGISNLLRQCLPPTGDAEPEHDLWPSMLRRIHAQPIAVPWFDWALAGGLAGFVIAFPAVIPVFLYCL